MVQVSRIALLLLRRRRLRLMLRDDEAGSFEKKIIRKIVKEEQVNMIDEHRFSDWRDLVEEIEKINKSNFNDYHQIQWITARI